MSKAFMVDIKGRIQNSKNEPLSGVLISAYDKWDVGGDHPVDPSPQKTALDGSFKILYNITNPKHVPHIFLVIDDSLKNFKYIEYGRSQFIRDTTSTRWRSEPIDQNDLGNVNITVHVKIPVILPDKYGAVVIGSGFGGTVISLALAKKFEEEDKDKGEKLKRRVCILERGQWWVSHEMPDSPEGTLDGRTRTLRTFLNENDTPYGLWAYPNNNKGLLHILGNVRSRPINSIRGLYDYTVLQDNNVHVITASGVGGGSLVYFNITERPDKSVLDQWESGLQLDINSEKMKPYYDMAEEVIGVNSIPTNAGLGRFRLPRSKVFQDATNRIHKTSPNLLVTNPDGSLDLDAKLSITDVPHGLFGNGHPTDDEVKKFSKQTNVCQRQGRCGLGCIPGARHTLNKQIYDAINTGQPLDVHPLCEVIDISRKETDDKKDYEYTVKFIDYRSVIDDPKINSFKDASDEKKKELTTTIKTKLVVLSAGSLGSTEILLKCRNLKLSKTLGSGFSTNGDMFGIINPTREIVDATRGPIQTSIARFKDGEGKFAFCIEDVGIPKIFAGIFANIANTMNRERGDIKEEPYRPKSKVQKLFRQNIVDGIANNINNPQIAEALFRMIESIDLSSLLDWVDRLMKLGDFLRLIDHNSQSPEELVYDKLILFGVGLDNGKGRLVPKADSSGIDLKDYSLNQQVFKDIIQGMKLFAKEIGKKGENSLVIPMWDTQNKTQIVAHPLGGCIMGKDPSKGVVNSMGKVFRVDSSGINNTSTSTPDYYDGLYVVDGSIVPTALGVNPSMTITSLALRIAEQEITKLKL